MAFVMSQRALMPLPGEPGLDQLFFVFVFFAFNVEGTTKLPCFFCFFLAGSFKQRANYAVSWRVMK